MNVNSFLKYFIWVGIFITPFIAFFLSGSTVFAPMLFPFITAKGFAFRIIVELIFGAWLILALRDNKYLPRKSWIVGAAAVFVAIIALADIFSENPYKSFWSNYERMEGFITLLHLFGYLVVAGTMLQGEKIWSWLLHTSIGASLFMSLYGMLQLNGELVINQGGVRMDGTLGNATYLAVYLLFHVFFIAFFCLSRHRGDLKKVLSSYLIGFGLFILYYLNHVAGAVNAQRPGVVLTFVALFGIAGAIYLWWLANKKQFPRFITVIAYVPLLVLQIFMMLATATRGTAIGLTVATLFIAVMFVTLGRKDKVARNTGIGIFIAAILFWGFLFAFKGTDFVKKSGMLSRLSTLATFDLKGFWEKEGKSRNAIWGMAWSGVQERPVLGWGQESFNYLFYKHYNPKMYDQEPWFDRAHNVVLDWLVAGGFLGLIAYLSLFGMSFYYLWRKRKHGFLSSLPLVGGVIEKVLEHEDEAHGKDFDFIERTVLSGLLIAYFLHNLTVFDNIVSYILFFTVLAYIHSVFARPFSEKVQAKMESFRNGVQAFAVPVVIVATLLVVYFANVPAMKASNKLAHALSPQQEGVGRNLMLYKEIFDIDSFGTSEAREFLTNLATNAAPVDASQLDPVTKSAIFNLASQQLRDQLTETPNDLRYYYFAGTLLNAYGRYQDALPVWEKALQISPKRQLILFNLAATYKQLGNNAKAAELLKRAYDLEPSYEAAAIEHYSITGQYDKLVQIWKQRVEKEPTNLQNHVSLAAAYIAAKQYSAAIAEIRLAIQLDPRFQAQGEQIIKDIQSGKIK